MYKHHPTFPLKSKDDEIIWRYMDFTKFVSLINSQSLFFSRADLLNDKFEGSYSKQNIIMRPELYKDSPNIPRLMGDIHKNSLKEIYINSWNISTVESAALWNLYAKSGYGIAVQSTIGRLKDCFKEANENIIISEVSYVDYDDFYIPEDNIYYPFFHKRKSFSHENEIRAIFSKFNDEKENGLPKETKGIYVPINTKQLIKRVYLSPGAPGWFLELLDSVLKKYEFKFKVLQSDLDRDPVY